MKVKEKNSIREIFPKDGEYPKRLLELHQPPQHLYIEGELRLGRSVAIVGTRTPSMQGLRCATRFASYLAGKGITIVSGLARGIDQAAHRGALEAGGETIAVLGSGLKNIYPEEHGPLAREIAKKGCLMSEFDFLAEPKAFHFPMRNRIMAALADVVLVIEAPRKSGTLITVDFALELNREIFVVPGSILMPQARGSNELIKQGAHCVTEPNEIMTTMHWDAR